MTEIDLGSDHLRAIAASVIRDDSVPFGAYAFATNEPGAELARAVELAVLLEAFGNTETEIAIEYARYEESSFFLCVIDHRRKVPTGAVRLILPTDGGPGLKTLNDLPSRWGRPADELLEQSGLHIPIERTWDIATLAVAPEYRSPMATGLVAMGLYQSGLRIAVEIGFEWMVAILDSAVYRMATARFHRPFFPFAEGRPYLGSEESLPVYLPIADFRRRLSVEDPPIHGILFEGVGIEAAVSPLPLETGVAIARRCLGVPAPKQRADRSTASAPLRVGAGGSPARPAQAPPERRAATA